MIPENINSLGTGTTRQDKTVLGFLKSQLDDWDKIRKNWETDWDRAYNRINNVSILEYNETERDEAWQSTQVIPLIRNKRRIALSLIEGTLFPEGKFPFGLKSTPVLDSEESKVFTEGFGISPEDRVRKMQDLIEDQLAESKARRELRKSLENLVDYGTCIMRGPVETWKPTNIWEPHFPEGMELPEILPPSSDPEENERAKISLRESYGVAMENISWEMVEGEKLTVETNYIDLWDAWLDPNADSAYEGAGVYERALLTVGEVADMADKKGADGKPLYDEEEIDRLLSSARRGAETTAAGGQYSRGPHRPAEKDANPKEEYEVFTYAGRVSKSVLEDHSDFELTGGKKYNNIERNKTVEVIAVFCRNCLLSIKEVKSRRGLRLYYSANYIRSSGGPYGYGLSWEMENAQSFANKMVRIFEDNTRLASCPPSTVNYRRLRNPTEKLRPGSRFDTKDGSSAKDVVSYANVPNVASASFEALKAAEDLAHMASGIPQFLEGDVLGNKAQTAYETSELKKSAMGQLGRIFQNIDDTIITPMIEGFYDWNMENAENPKDIMGDFSIVARGYFSFKENLEALAGMSELLQLSITNDKAAKYTKIGELLTEYYRRKGLKTTQFLYSKEEVAENDRIEAENQQAAISAQQQKDAQKAELEAAKIQSKVQNDDRLASVKEGELSHKIDYESAKLALEKEKIDGSLVAEGLKEEGRRLGLITKNNNGGKNER